MSWWRDDKKFSMTLNRLVSQGVIEYRDPGKGSIEPAYTFTEGYRQHIRQYMSELLVLPEQESLRKDLLEGERRESNFTWAVLCYLSYVGEEHEEHLGNIGSAILAIYHILFHKDPYDVMHKAFNEFKEREKKLRGN